MAVVLVRVGTQVMVVTGHLIQVQVQVVQVQVVRVAVAVGDLKDELIIAAAHLFGTAEVAVAVALGFLVLVLVVRAVQQLLVGALLTV
jgi:hypothetical protein